MVSYGYRFTFTHPSTMLMYSSLEGFNCLLVEQVHAESWI